MVFHNNGQRNEAMGNARREAMDAPTCTVARIQSSAWFFFTGYGWEWKTERETSLGGKQ